MSEAAFRASSVVIAGRPSARRCNAASCKAARTYAALNSLACFCSPSSVDDAAASFSFFSTACLASSYARCNVGGTGFPAKASIRAPICLSLAEEAVLSAPKYTPARMSVNVSTNRFKAVSCSARASNTRGKYPSPSSRMSLICSLVFSAFCLFDASMLFESVSTFLSIPLNWLLAALKSKRGISVTVWGTGTTVLSAPVSNTFSNSVSKACCLRVSSSTSIAALSRRSGSGLSRLGTVPNKSACRESISA